MKALPEGYTYVIQREGPDSSFNYEVQVYYQGRRIQRFGPWADTRWGGRRRARRLARAHAAMPDPDNPAIVERGAL